MENYSLSDIAAVSDRGGWGGNGWGGVLAGGLGGLLLGGAFGGNGGLFGGNRSNCATTEDLASGFNFQALQNKGNEALAAIQGTNQNLSNAVCQLGYQDAQHAYDLGSKIDNCCCNNQIGIQGVKFDMANYASAIQMNDTANTQKVLDKLCAMESAQKDATIAAQGQRINQLENDLRFCRIPVISNVGWTVNPVPGCGYGCNNNI